MIAVEYCSRKVIIFLLLLLSTSPPDVSFSVASFSPPQRSPGLWVLLWVLVWGWRVSPRASCLVDLSVDLSSEHGAGLSVDGDM